ncbi:MAG: carboxypeptidase-like regulatory domain-containing protein [Clostridiales bacterium]|nr:carboxypeptidase-like regulatory domain-containing protein [Clostridiales bacterium]
MKKTAAFAMLACFICLFPACGKGTRADKNESPVCVMRLCVRDGPADEPIYGACVVVPETGERFYTDENGLTPKMELPVIPDENLSGILPSRGGRITFIVYAEGYTPYLLLYARTFPGVRDTPTALLFPDDGTLPVFTVIEAPDEGWCRELAEKFRP